MAQSFRLPTRRRSPQRSQLSSAKGSHRGNIESKVDDTRFRESEGHVRQLLTSRGCLSDHSCSPQEARPPPGVGNSPRPLGRVKRFIKNPRSPREDLRLQRVYRAESNTAARRGRMHACSPLSQLTKIIPHPGARRPAVNKAEPRKLI